MATGFFTDTTLCIGCKACEVACKQWNQLPADGYKLTGMSYDNTAALSATTWRHVAFIEKTGCSSSATPAAIPLINTNGYAGMQLGMPDVSRWLMMSDVCKHCENAGCLNACPTGAIIRNEFGAVYIQPDICNGCGYCVPSCPFGVVALQHDDGRAFKCTLCYDRQKDGLEPACAKACPTDSILFGELETLQEQARQRVADLQARGETKAYLYGLQAAQDAQSELPQSSVGDLHAFFLLTEEPAAYGLPRNPILPQERLGRSYLAGVIAGVALAVFSAITLRRKK